MSDRQLSFLVQIGAPTIALAVTVAFAYIGEPRSEWFICDLLGFVEVCQ